MYTYNELSLDRQTTILQSNPGKETIMHILTMVKLLHNKMIKWFVHSYSKDYVSLALESLRATELGIDFRRGELLLWLLEDMQLISKAHHWGIKLI